MKTPVAKRGAARRGLELLSQLRSLLRSDATPERMLGSVASLLAVGDRMCIVDVVDEPDRLRRLTIVHADPSLRERLRAAVQSTKLAPGGRVARLFDSRKSELTPVVTRALRSGSLADVADLSGEPVRSYMATPILVSGAPFAALTVVTARPTRDFDRDDLELLCTVGDWTGLGLENALRRQLQPRESVLPAARLSTPRPIRAITR